MKASYLVEGTPVEAYSDGIWVKREDLSCPPPGPPFAKTRGVFAHVAKQTAASYIGVLDTAHSQAGHAVAQACRELGKTCLNFYPVFKAELRGPGVDLASPGAHDLRPFQQRAKALGAVPIPLAAGRSAILFHEAKKRLAAFPSSYMMPNALKLPEMVEEVAKEVARTDFPPGLLFDQLVISVSSGTIAAGVVRGFAELGYLPGRVYLHLGYSRSAEEVRRYVLRESALVFDGGALQIVDEGYSYSDRARPGPTPPFPCNPYYDLKAYRWLLANRANGRLFSERVLFWNIG